MAFELKDDIKPWRDEVTAPVRAFFLRNCLFAYGEKVAILPKIIRVFQCLSSQFALWISQQSIEIVYCLSLSLIQIGIKIIEQNSTAPTIFYCLLQIEHGTINVLALGYDIQMMPPRNGEESLLTYLGYRLLHIYIV